VSGVVVIALQETWIVGGRTDDRDLVDVVRTEGKKVSVVLQQDHRRGSNLQGKLSVRGCVERVGG
jgi:hypothetical protein